MKPLITSLALALTCSTVVAVAAPAEAATRARPIVTGELSFSSVAGRLPVGAVVSVVQVCSKGSLLDRSGTRMLDAQVDPGIDPHLRLVSRELWSSGTVSRYRVAKRVAVDDGVLVLTAALCRGAVAGTAKKATGRAFSDLRVWGPAPTRLDLVNVTTALVSDDVRARGHFATVMKAAGVSSSRGSLRGAVEALQATAVDLGAVAAFATTHRTVRRGQFVSMKNSYRYTSDLRRKSTAYSSR